MSNWLLVAVAVGVVAAVVVVAVVVGAVMTAETLG